MTETGAVLRPAREFGALAVAMCVAAAIWWGIWALCPAPEQLGSLQARLGIALECLIVATTFTLLPGIEAVGHERLITPAFDPLSGTPTRRIVINNRFIQNTVEQLPIFAAGLAGIVIFADGPGAFRALIAATTVWTLARWTFWIGYHLGPQHRVAGLVGVLQSIVIILWSSAHVGFEIGGVIGACTALGAYALCELAIVFGLTRRGNSPPARENT